ncbi:MAG: hypothetical protein JXR76_12830 [Deltaproteobacteria bacterium]|nr:hypothetical protein [Deltaproteobacteria bacterium]
MKRIDFHSGCDRSWEDRRPFGCLFVLFQLERGYTLPGSDLSVLHIRLTLSFSDTCNHLSKGK